jgi:crossover junction endodeoxyribonuclease RuvC
MKNMTSSLNRRHLICGIDPGLSGSIAYYDPLDGYLRHVFDMPIQSTKSGKNEIDAKSLANLIGKLSSETILAVIEDPHAMPEQGVTSTFNFGKGCGIVIGIVAGNLIPFHLTRPSVWKAVMGLSSDKNLSRKKAIAKWPMHESVFKRKKDDGRAEAALLALFGERILG